MDFNALVSVIIPIHNNEKTIARALDSVLAQTYQNFEIIVIDDCSQDNGPQIVEEYIEKDKRISLIRNETNLKAAITRNVGINAAKGEYIAFLDGDDAYHPIKLEYDIGFLQDRPYFDLVSNQYHSMALYGKGNQDMANFVYKEASVKSMLKKSSVFTSTVVMKSSIKERFSGEYPICEDLFYWVNILLAGHRIAVTNHITSYYNNEYSNRLSLNFKLQHQYEKKIVDYAYEHKAINGLEKCYLKCLYFLKFIRRPLKFKWLAHKEKRLQKKAGK